MILREQQKQILRNAKKMLLSEIETSKDYKTKTLAKKDLAYVEEKIREDSN